MNPFQLFETWFAKEKEISNLRLPAACCLSTLGLDGYPNSRFVSLKEVKNGTFIITGSLDSRKGLEVGKHPRAALSFWWTATERQVRIQGDVFTISNLEADHYFNQRNRDSQIVSSIFKQGHESDRIDSIKKLFEIRKEDLVDKVIERPDNWGGIAIEPVKIEFMDFKLSRLHERQLFTRHNNVWKLTILQP